EATTKSKQTPEEESPTPAKGAADSLDTELAKTTLSTEDREKVVDEIGRREKVVWLGQPVPMIRFVRDAFVGFFVGALALGITALIACCVGSGSLGGVGTPTLGSVALGLVLGGIPTLFVVGMFGLIFFLSRKAARG